MNINKVIKVSKQYLTAATIFVILASIFGLLFVFKTPLLWGEDEITHFDRAYQISQGHFLSAPIGKKDYGGMVPQTAYNLASYVTNDLSNGVRTSSANNGIKWVTNSNKYKLLGSTPINGKKVLMRFPNTAAYSPVAYIPSVLGLLFSEAVNFNLATTIYTARLFALVFYIVCIYFLLKSLQNYRARWLIFAVALLPTALYQASTITADTMTITTIIVISSLFLKTFLGGKLNRIETAALLVAVLLLPLVKPTYILFSLFIILVPIRLLSIRIRLGNYLKYGVLLTSFVLFAYWSYLTKSLVNAPSLALPYYWASAIDPHKQLHYAISHPISVAKVFIRTTIVNDDYYLTGAIGGFGYNNVQAPGIVVLSSLAAMGLSVLGLEKIKTSTAKLLSLMAIFIGSLVALYFTFYLTITPVGVSEGPVGMIVQGLMGRYFIPYIILVLIILGCIFKPRLAQNKNSDRALSTTIVILTAFGLLLTFLKYYYVTWG